MLFMLLNSCTKNGDSHGVTGEKADIAVPRKNRADERVSALFIEFLRTEIDAGWLGGVFPQARVAVEQAVERMAPPGKLDEQFLQILLVCPGTGW
jgi:hypothetical protein